MHRSLLCRSPREIVVQLLHMCQLPIFFESCLERKIPDWNSCLVEGVQSALGGVSLKFSQFDAWVCV